MTNPDHEELVKLADRLAALPTFKMATVVMVPGVACDERERDLIVTALRRLASSDDGMREADRLREVLKRISALTPGDANAFNARDMHLTVKAIVDAALYDHALTTPGATKAIYICYDGYGHYYISRERPTHHVAIIYDEDVADELVAFFNHDTPHTHPHTTRPIRDQEEVMGKKPSYYTLTPIFDPEPSEFRVVNASVGTCCTCGGIATGMGSSPGDVCLRCADVLLSGGARGAIVWGDCP